MLPVDIYLIRGLAREAAHWGDFIPLLEQQDFVADIVCLDLPGAGQFSKLTSPISIGENAEFLLSQIDDSSPRLKVIISVSLGSMVAIEMLQRKPDLFYKGYVMNTSFSNLSPLYHRLQLFAFKQFYKVGVSKNLEERELQIVKMVSQSSDKWQKVSKEWAQIAKERPMPLQNFFRQLIAGATYKISKKKPKTPIIVFNSQRDQMVHPSCSEKLAQHWGLPLYKHPTAGHDLCIDEQDWVIEKIKQTIFKDS